jgi:hypothetical protein
MDHASLMPSGTANRCGLSRIQEGGASILDCQDFMCKLDSDAIAMEAQQPALLAVITERRAIPLLCHINPVM